MCALGNGNYKYPVGFTRLIRRIRRTLEIILKRKVLVARFIHTALFVYDIGAMKPAPFETAVRSKY